MTCLLDRPPPAPPPPQGIVGFRDLVKHKERRICCFIVSLLPTLEHKFNLLNTEFLVQEM